MPDSKPVVRCAIHPSVGVARVGNAPADEYYLAPEVPGRAADPGPQGYKNAKGQVRKEAARFRIYGYDKKGNVVREITAEEAEITWEVHLANRKPAWYQFMNAMDLKQYAFSTTYRNADVTGELRQALVNDPGALRISGRDTHGARYRFDQGYYRFSSPTYIAANATGPFQVPLGELRTDGQGRLIVLGGDGKSASALGQPATTFANNDGWYDDVSDGPVRARVKLKGGQEMDAEPAMVVVTPPNFGPGLYGTVRLFDVIQDLFLRQGWEKPLEELTFWGQIHPIFERMVNSQWVMQGSNILFGPGSPGDLTDPERLKVLSDPGKKARPERERVFRLFRQPVPPWDSPAPKAVLPPPQPSRLPPFYGDGFGDYARIAIDGLALTETQHEWLRQWAEGKFVPGKRSTPPARLEDLPLAEQPRALDRTPLEDCLGGPFHPGIEMTWPMRRPSLWQPPKEANGLLYRLNILPPGESPKDDYGTVLTPELCLGPDGPLNASGPGSLSRWMGVPWQTDEASCLNGYDVGTYLPLPSFWAARVPNEVLSQHAFDQATRTDLPYATRFRQLSYRQSWLRDLQGSGYTDRINNMVKNWHLLGIIAEQPVPPAESLEPGFPARYWVETGLSRSFTDADQTWRQLLLVEGLEPDEQRTEMLRKAAQPVQVLAEERGEDPAEVVHPLRLQVRRDQH
jgi:hypothetical protein